MVVLALLLTNCSPAATPAVVEKPTDVKAAVLTEKPADAPATEKVTLKLWIFEGEEAFLPELKKRFEAKFPNIALEITEIPESEYVTKIDTALAANDPPDIAFIYEKRWLKAGKFLPLDEMIAQKGIDLKTYNQAAVADCIFEDKIYCLGSYSGAIMLFYNKDLFDKAGVPYPAADKAMTIDEYATLAAKLSQPNDDITKRVWGGSSSAHYWWTDWRTGFSEDGRKIEGYINDEKTVHLYEVLTQMVKDGHAPSNADMQLLGGADILASGQQAMSIIDNIIAIKSFEANNIRWGAAPTPVEVGDQPFVNSWTDSFGIFNQSKYPAEALEFVGFLTTEGNRLRVEVGGDLPLDTAVAEAMNWAGQSEGRQEALQVIKLARPNIFVPGFWEVTGVLEDAFSEVVEGQKTAQQALDDVAPDMQKSLDTQWETWEEIK
jgi:multiple sugar transport system substrate-binding protein